MNIGELFVQSFRAVLAVSGIGYINYIVPHSTRCDLKNPTWTNSHPSFPLLGCRFDCSHVILPKELAKTLPKSRLLSESEWRGIGVQQSRGWVHYAIHRWVKSSTGYLGWIMGSCCRVSYAVICWCLTCFYPFLYGHFILALNLTFFYSGVPWERILRVGKLTLNWNGRPGMNTMLNMETANKDT